MKTKRCKQKELSLTILGIDHHIRRKVFDSKDFISSVTTNISSREQDKRAWSRSPLTDMDIDLFDASKAFHHLAKAIDTSLLSVTIPSSNQKIQLRALREDAKAAAPGMQINAAFDVYTKSRYGESYSGLIERARTKVIDRFKAAFSENLYESPMNGVHLTGHQAEIFSHNPVWAPEKAIKEYKSLAKQGHVYSQYLAGLLLASHVSGYSPACIRYLLMAYENKHPEAMRVLAEYLLYREDYLGALQCGLLSVDGGDDHSRKIVRRVLAVCTMRILNTDRGIVPFSSNLLHTILNSGLDYILKEHFRDLLPETRAEVQS